MGQDRSRKIGIMHAPENQGVQHLQRTSRKRVEEEVLAWQARPLAKKRD